jgi:hypothetical protein
MLHDKHTDIVSGAQATYGISHMKTYSLLPNDNSSDINFGSRLNDGIDWIANNEFYTFPL